MVASLNDAAKQDTLSQPIVFLHYPPVYGNMACAGILDVLETRHVEQCYFGHIHGNQASKKAVRGNYHGIKMHLISCDYVNFYADFGQINCIWKHIYFYVINCNEKIFML